MNNEILTIWDIQGMYIVKHSNFPNNLFHLNTNGFKDLVISTLVSFRYVIQIFYTNSTE